MSLVQFCWTQAGLGGILGILSELTVQCWDMHMFLHRCPPSSSLVDSLSKASYLARPYVLGHGDSGMWKEQRIILGLQTPSGAIPSKFCRHTDPELLILHCRAHGAIRGNSSPHLSKSGARKPLPFVLPPNQLSPSSPWILIQSRGAAHQAEGEWCLQVRLCC